MANITIPDLPAAIALTGAENIPAVQSGSTVRITTAQIAGLSTPGANNSLITATGSTTPRTLANRFADAVNVKDFGAVGDGVTDDTAAIQAAVAAVPSSGGDVYFPAGRYKISTEITIISKVVYLRGDGAGASFIVQTGAAANGINFNNATYMPGGGISGLSIHAGSLYNTGTGSTGSGIKVQKVNGNFICQDFEVQAFATGVLISQSFYAKFEDFQVLYSRDYGFILATPGAGVASAGITVARAKISNFGFTGVNTGSVGLFLQQSAGDFISDIDITSHNTSILINPTTPDQVNYLFAKSVIADTAVNDGWDINALSGDVVSNTFVDCWAGYMTNGSGVRLRGVVDGLSWIGGRVRENGSHGFNIENGKNIAINGCMIAQNSKLTTLTSDGVSVGASVQSLSILGCRIGNYSSGGAWKQAAGIKINVSFAGRISIGGCDTSNAGAGYSGISNSSSVTPLMYGNFPIASGYNPPLGYKQTLCTVGAIAAASTIYLGPNAEQVLETAAYILVNQASSVTKFRFQVDTAPGAGQTFTYTLRKNLVDTALTGTISGAASYEVIAYGAISVVDGDFITMRVVTSAGAASARHRGYIEMSA